MAKSKVERRGRKPEDAAKLIKHYRDHPAKWIEDAFGVELWEKQVEIVNTVWNNRYTAVKSCYASGKSFTGAVLVHAFVHLYKPSIVVTTAPTYSQLSNIWQEVNRLHENAIRDLGSECLKHELRLGSGHRAVGISTNVPENIQGRHAPHVLIIEDESAAIDEEIHKRLNALMTGEDCHMLSIGNPLDPSGHFHEMFQNPDIAKMTISAFDTPNVQEGEEVIPGLVTQTWIEERRQEYGKGSPLWKSEVLGEFPPEAEDTLIPLSWVRKAQVRWQEAQASDGQTVYGLDPSGGGMNETCICPRTGNYVHNLKAKQVSEPQEIVNFTRNHIPFNYPVYLDKIGVGFGIEGMLANEGFSTTGVNVQTKPTSDEAQNRFRNLRAQLYWSLRDQLNPNQKNPMALPPDDTLASQLTAIKYETDTKGRIKIESKKDMEMDSPDRADALMLTEMANVHGNAMPLSVGVREGSGFESANLAQAEQEFGYVSWQDFYR